MCGLSPGMHNLRKRLRCGEDDEQNDAVRTKRIQRVQTPSPPATCSSAFTQGDNAMDVTPNTDVTSRQQPVPFTFQERLARELQQLVSPKGSGALIGNSLVDHELPNYASLELNNQFSATSNQLPSQPPLYTPMSSPQTSPRKDQLESPSTQRRMVGFRMGYRRDCEKCRQGCPGHYLHVLTG
ncbi:hypothetical protein HDU85_004166 [Gaertneriomyces sp. JEL0708]|nr:hypothetical protein HDU85_004166 [Gaertneriomyces sp. JEL0708]